MVLRVVGSKPISHPIQSPGFPGGFLLLPVCAFPGHGIMANRLLIWCYRQHVFPFIVIFGLMTKALKYMFRKRNLPVVLLLLCAGLIVAFRSLGFGDGTPPTKYEKILHYIFFTAETRRSRVIAEPYVASGISILLKFLRENKSCRVNASLCVSSASHVLRG